VCGFEDYYEPVPGRVRLDPLDPKTSRHAAQCQFRSETDPVLIKAILKVTEKDRYAWVECNSCSFGWQVADYASASG
jgi:hypothetical protein